MSTEFSPTPAQTESTSLNRLQSFAENARTGVSRAAAAGLLVITGATVTFAGESIASPTVASADAISDALAAYPNKSMPCEHAPYNVTGACANYDWGPVHTTATGDPSTNSSRGYGYRNCTDWVAWRVAELGGSIPTTLGNAKDWPSEFSASDVSSTPAPGDIAVSTSGTYGHVAFVESVNSLAGTMVVSEYNENEQGDGDQRTLPTSGSEFNDFIYVSDSVNSTGSSGTGPTPNIPLVGDVTGDGKADAVIVNPTSGDAWAATSNGSSFNAPTEWSANPAMAGATRYFLADVDGDGREDLVAFYASTGTWKAATSSGSGFWPPTTWAVNEGGNSSNQFVADVTGDGKADVVLFWNQVAGQPNGMWAVDASSGSGFYGPPNQWITGAGVGSNSQDVGDFNGDGKIDVGMYYNSTGVWDVSLSTGSNFGYPGQWSYGHGNGSTEQYAADVNGDGRADEIYYWDSHSGICGTWEAGMSAGSGFYTPTYWQTSGTCGNTNTNFVADVNGDGKADAITYWEANPGWDQGTWTVGESSGSGFYGPPTQWMHGFGDNEL